MDWFKTLAPMLGTALAGPLGGAAAAFIADKRLPGHLSFSFHGLEGETIRLLLLLDENGIAVSAGSACSSNDKAHNASHVLQAIGLNPFEARGAIRVSMGRYTTEMDIDIFTDSLGQAVNNLTSIFSEKSIINL